MNNVKIKRIVENTKQIKLRSLEVVMSCSLKKFQI